MCLGYLFNLLDRCNKQQHKLKEAVFQFSTVPYVFAKQLTNFMERSACCES
jgi:hypothetical protein